MACGPVQPDPGHAFSPLDADGHETTRVGRPGLLEFHGAPPEVDPSRDSRRRLLRQEMQVGKPGCSSIAEGVRAWYRGPPVNLSLMVPGTEVRGLRLAWRSGSCG
jgi:hypothetical protein